MNINSEEILCYCNDVKVNYIRKIIEEKPDISFNDLQDISNAGKNCTACILDLEDVFINRTASENLKDKNFLKKKFFKNGLKKTIYNFIDFISPSIPIVINNFFPVLFCRNLENFIWVANFSNLYEFDKNLVEHDIILFFYNTHGKLIWKKKFFLKKKTDLKIKIPTHLLKSQNDKEIEHGWLHLKKKAKKKGYLGTTRPQIQYITNLACCAVHGQDIKEIYGGSHSFVYNNNSERQFLSFFNIGSKATNLEIMLLKKEGAILNLFKISLDSLNSFLYEIKLEHLGINKFETINIRWSGLGMYKCHVIITDMNLSRFSVDHQ
jgi:bacterioferritin-associated ferredoxin